MNGPRRARLYNSVRTAHLERARDLPPAAIVYSQRRYDFDESAAAGLHLVHAPGLRAVVWLARNRPEIIEINEPLMMEATIWTASALAVVNVLTFGRRKPRVVTYAIENLDPRTTRVARTGWSGLKHIARRKAEDVAAQYLWRRVDRVAFGTSDAEELYQHVLGPNSAEKQLIWALPSPIRDDAGSRSLVAVFVSAFSERKGVRQLLDAWRRVHLQCPSAKLTMIGTGALTDLVRQSATLDESLQVLIDPPRAEIHEALANARVVVLPSQPSATWREQVGLPIVEGLSHGCTIVTTSETGLAKWLADNHHHVVPATDHDALVSALLDALANPLSVQEVWGSLPSEDGRLAADRWLFGDEGAL